MYFIFWRAVRLSRKQTGGRGRGRVSCGGWGSGSTLGVGDVQVVADRPYMEGLASCE